MAGTACKEWRGPYVKNVDFTQEMPTMNTGKVLEMSPQSLTTPSQLFMHFFTQKIRATFVYESLDSSLESS